MKQQFKEEIEKAKHEEGKSKTKFLLNNKGQWSPGICPDYMRIMTRTQASVVFKARTRMLECKGNFKQKNTKEI